MKDTARIIVVLVFACILTASCSSMSDQKTDRFDLVLRNGWIIDGTGSPRYRSDIGIRGDAIAAIGDLAGANATEMLDVEGLVVSPGFIDLLGWSHGPVLVDPNLEGKIRQGVTTEATGEGRSPGPVYAEPVEDEENPVELRTLGDFMRKVERGGTALNFAFFVGATNPREMILGKNNVQPTEEQLREMEQIVDLAMREGAIGLSTSLVYVPAIFSTTDEIARLAGVAAKYGGVYFSHIRSESDEIEQALEEAFEIGRRTGIPVNIWHLKVTDRNNEGKMARVLEMIENARDEGLDVAANAYPYAASSTGLSALAPNWSLEGGYTEFLRRLSDDETRAGIAVEIRESSFYRRVGGASGVLVSNIGNSDLDRFEKKFLSAIAEEMGVDPIEALLRLLEGNETSPQAIYFLMKEDDVRMALARSWVSIGADSGAVVGKMREAGAHPRAYGTFPRVLGHYVRDVKLFSLEEAVRKMTSQAASRIRVNDRGALRQGMKADIVVFDPEEIRDVSTFEDPHHFSEGILHVIVNGVPVLRDGEMTGELPGRVLRGAGYRP